MPDFFNAARARLWIWIHDETGEGVTEYALIAILVALLGILALSMLGVSNSLLSSAKLI